MLRDSIPVVLLILAFFFTAHDAAKAEVATAQEMEWVCRNWLAYIMNDQGGWAGSAKPSIAGFHDIQEKGFLLGRCFAVAPMGYVVVPSLKELPPVKAYSEENGYGGPASEGLPRMVKDVLLHRVELFIKTYGSLDACQPSTGEVLFDRCNRKAWDWLLVNPILFKASLDPDVQKSLTQVGPLLSTHWHQNAPFNLFCPMGKGGRSVAGCVATAAAQIMKYHEWPPEGVGSHAYWWDGEGGVPGDWLHVDFSDPYDWDLMPDDGSKSVSEEKVALAELCYEVGVAFEMDFGHGVSTADTAKALTALPTFFRYDPSVILEERKYHTAESWFELVKSEIKAKRPMLYVITYHAMVCDGWRKTENGQHQFHFNFGWDDHHSGWYALDHIKTSPNTLEEQVVRNIFPADPAKVFMVSWTGTGDFHHIQDAIDAVSEPNMTVLVYPGTYQEVLEFGETAVAVRSTFGPFDTMIDGQMKGSVVSFVNGGSGSSLTGFTVTNGSSQDGGGIFCTNASPVIENCIIVENTAGARGGGIFCAGGHVKCVNNIVHGNAAYQGGGIYAGAGSLLTVTNNTLHGNAASQRGGAIDSEEGEVKVTNTIIWKNSAGKGAQIHGGGAAVTYSDVQGGYPGKGNKKASPLFKAPAEGDFRVKHISPCRNSGHNKAPAMASIDIEGEYRIYDGTVDIGADESNTGLFVTVNKRKFKWKAGKTFKLAVNDEQQGLFTLHFDNTFEAADQEGLGFAGYFHILKKGKKLKFIPYMEDESHLKQSMAGWLKARCADKNKTLKGIKITFSDLSLSVSSLQKTLGVPKKVKLKAKGTITALVDGKKCSEKFNLQDEVKFKKAL